MLLSRSFPAALVVLALFMGWGYAIDAQEMQSSPKDFGLVGKVQSAETVRVDVSTKSYRIRAGQREFLEDFGNPSTGSPDKALLWSLLKFNSQGKLIEDVDLDRSIDQESYRYKYTYDQSGRLIEKRGYKENGAFDERVVYVYGPGGKRIEQLFYSEGGRILGRYNFDAYENITLVEWYNEDGSVRQREDHRYEYVTKGNVLEQVYYPPERHGIGLRRLATSPSPDIDEADTSRMATPQAYRTVYVRDEAGHLREESRYVPDGSLLEKKSFDENGILRKSEWRVGELSATTTLYNELGNTAEMHTFAKEGFGSPRAVDDRTVFFYDAHGNPMEIVTSGPDRSLVSRTTTVYEYDQYGNWIKKIETNLNNVWKTEPFQAAFETISEFRRTITYF